MGRRIKESESVHRENIASAAERLFASKGIEATTMDDIAKEAVYSKATLYVYFKNKDEIVAALVLNSMKLLHEHIRNAILKCNDTKARYLAICYALVDYQEQFPFYFEIALGEINVDFKEQETLPLEKEIFEIGECINAELVNFIRIGIQEGALRPNIPILQTVFLFWASLSGTILMGSKKQMYIKKAMRMTKEQFLSYGFDTLYRSIEVEGSKR